MGFDQFGQSGVDLRNGFLFQMGKGRSKSSGGIGKGQADSDRPEIDS